LATTPKQTKPSKRSTARTFWAARWSSTKRVRSVKVEAPAADVVVTAAGVAVVDAEDTAAEVVAVAVEDEVAAVDTVVAAEAAAIANLVL
jgi:hypothetical protein